MAADRFVLVAMPIDIGNPDTASANPFVYIGTLTAVGAVVCLILSKAARR